MIPTVHKESCRFYAKDPLAKAVPGSYIAGSKRKQ